MQKAETSTLDQITDFYIRNSLVTSIKKGETLTPIESFVVDKIAFTYFDLKQKLGISFPIRLRASTEFDVNLYQHQPDDTGHTYAYFLPIFNDEGNKVTSGEMVINSAALSAYVFELNRGENRRPFTPWQLLADIHHELKHADQFDKDPVESMRIYKNEPYYVSMIEYDAELYAFDSIKKIRPWGISDYIDRHFMLDTIHSHLKQIRDNRKKLNLPT